MKNKKTILLFLVTIISVLLGFIKESAIVNSMGVSRDADLFIFASNMPMLLFSAIGTVLSTTFMPIYTDLRINYNTKEANGFASQFLKYIIVICLAIVLLGELFPNLVVRAMAPGLRNLEMINMIIRIVLPSIILLAILYIFIGILNSYSKVLITSAVQIPINITLIFSPMIIYRYYGLKYSVLMIIIGILLQLLLIYFPTKKIGFKFEKQTNITNKFLKKSLAMIIPMAIGAMAMQLNSLVATNLASRLGEGSITIINLANKLYSASYSTIGYLLVIIIFPILSELAAKSEKHKMSDTLTNGIIKSIIVITPVMIIMILLSSDIVRFFFGNSMFREDKIRITGIILSIYSSSLILWGVKDILNRAYYSLKETKISMKNGIITVSINIIISLLLLYKLGIIALALASTISSLISVILLTKNLKQVDLSIDKNKIFNILSKVILASIITSLGILKLKSILYSNIYSKIDQFTMLSIISISTIVIYVIILMLLSKNNIIKIFRN